MVLSSALLKTQGMTLKILPNSFMPHYHPIYNIYLQRVLACSDCLFQGCPYASVLCAMEQEETHRLDVSIVGEGFPGGDSGKEPVCQYWGCKRCGFDPWVGKIPWRRKWQPTPVFLSGKSHGQRSLAGCSPWGHKESDMTEHIHTHTHTIVGNASIDEVKLRFYLVMPTTNICFIF